MNNEQKYNYGVTEELAGPMDENNGFCVACGEVAYGGIEPDARRYKCESCGSYSVYGMEEMMLYLLMWFTALTTLQRFWLVTLVWPARAILSRMR